MTPTPLWIAVDVNDPDVAERIAKQLYEFSGETVGWDIIPWDDPGCIDLAKEPDRRKAYQILTLIRTSGIKLAEPPGSSVSNA